MPAEFCLPYNLIYHLFPGLKEFLLLPHEPCHPVSSTGNRVRHKPHFLQNKQDPVLVLCDYKSQQAIHFPWIVLSNMPLENAHKDKNYLSALQLYLLHQHVKNEQTRESPNQNKSRSEEHTSEL